MGSVEGKLNGDPELMTQWRVLGELWVQGSARIDLLEPAPRVA